MRDVITGTVRRSHFPWRHYENKSINLFTGFTGREINFHGDTVTLVAPACFCIMSLNFGNRDKCGNRVGGILRKVNERSIILAGILFLALIQSSFSGTQSVTLGWEPSLEPNVVGYRIYYGILSHDYTNHVTVENGTSATITGLVSGQTYYFAATTLNAQSQESDFSNEAMYEVPVETQLKTLQIRKMAAGQFMLTMNGPAKQNLAIEATSDFQVWNVVGTATTGPDGSVNFTDTNAVYFPQRFYRTRQLPPDKVPYNPPAAQ